MKHAEKFLIVSLGSIGLRHLRNLRQLRPQASIAVLRTQTSTSGLDIPEGADFQFSTIEEAIDFKPQAAIVAGPATTHTAVALTLAKSGISLLIEKPIADKLNGLDELIATCKKNNLTLMAGYNLRFLPSLQKTKKIYQEGLLGKVYSVRAEVGQYLPDWRPQSDYRKTVTAQKDLGGGALLELSHEIDYIYWLFGAPDNVTMRAGKFSALEIDVEDVVELIMEYESSKRIVNIHLDLLQRAPFRQCKLVGENGTLIWNAIKDQLEHFDVTTKTWHLDNECSLQDKNKMYLDELALFLNNVSSGKANVDSGEQGYAVLKIVEAARQSLKTNQSVRLEA